MKLLAVVLALVLVIGAVAKGAVTEEKGEVAHLRVRRWGFGCPFNARRCHRHCRSIRRRAGYCAGRLRLTCTCVR
ncbi:4 kDa defensin-like [Haemaphysalis longicornis]|uniref:Defensin DSF1 n=1 Tax=Haemaphysalis longicornis TaxID=44386 RepID=A0A2D1CLH8_HAELO|nr:defensin DSF1 [Haemaphysalis longicornis]